LIRLGTWDLLAALNSGWTWVDHSRPDLDRTYTLNWILGMNQNAQDGMPFWMPKSKHILFMW